MPGLHFAPRAALAGAATLMMALGACSSGGSATAGAVGSPRADSADGGAAVCNPVPPLVCPDPPPHYADVQGAFEARCVPCHNDTPDAAWPLQTYRQIADWQDVVRDDLILCTMPPPDGGITMTEAERTAILTWIHCGYPE